MSGRFLTAKQIRISDEIAADTHSAEKTLKVALNYHANVTTEIHRRTTALWRELNQIHVLDDEREYEILYRNGRHEIVEVKKGGDGR